MDKTQKTLAGAFFLPLLLALYCLVTQEYLRHVDKQLCKPKPATSEKYTFDVSGNHSSPFSAEVSCSSSETQFVYVMLGFAAVICFGLSTVLPCIILLRQRPVEETKLFE